MMTVTDWATQLRAEADACEAEARRKFRPHQDGPDQQAVGVLIVQARTLRDVADRMAPAAREGGEEGK